MATLLIQISGLPPITVRESMQTIIELDHNNPGKFVQLSRISGRGIAHMVYVNLSNIVWMMDQGGEG